MLRAIPSTHVESIWPFVVDRIASACKRCSDLLDADDVLKALLNRDMQLWTYGEPIEAIAVTEIIVHPNRKVANIRIGTGEGREHWQHLRGQIEAWAIANGCAQMRIEARIGWEKIFADYRKTHIVLEKELSNG